MKYILTIALMFVAIAQTQAQGGITIEVKGGFNSAKAVVENEFEIYEGETNKSLTGIHLGAIVGILITETYSFETGMMFSQKGAKTVYNTYFGFDEIGSSNFPYYYYVVENKVILNYLDIPLHIKGTFPINEDVSFFGIVGPTISFALNGESKSQEIYIDDKSGDSETTKTSNDINFGSNAGKFKSLDFGITFGAGFSYNEFSFGLNYDLGLTDLSNIVISSHKNRVFRISVGYRLF